MGSPERKQENPFHRKGNPLFVQSDPNIPKGYFSVIERRNQTGKTRHLNTIPVTKRHMNHRVECQLIRQQFRWFKRRKYILSCFHTLTNYEINILSSRIVFTLFLVFLSVLVPQSQASEYINSNNLNVNKNSGQFFVSQLCPSKSQFPITKRVEGAVLSSIADTDVNCTIIFRTKSAQQHFVIRFEELRLGCDDHLKMFDGDLDYGQPSIKDFSCRDSLASVPIIKTTGTYLTMRLSTDSKTKPNDGFRLVVTAVFDVPSWDCPIDYTLCHNRLCIAKSLFCDDVNHCLDNSDETSCSSRNAIGGVGSLGGKSNGDSFFSGELTLSNALGLLVVLVLVIFTCVIIFILAIYCRRESHYAQYQHHLQRAIGVPLQTSSSLMFTTNQPQYHYFQPANFSPFVTPQHHAAATLANATLPRGYSTLPLNLARPPAQLQLQQQPQQQLQQQLQQQPIQTIMTTQGISRAPTVANNNEHLMIAAGLAAGPSPTASMQPALFVKR